MITPEQQQQIQDRLKGTAPATPATAGGSNWYASLKQQNAPAPTPSPADSPVMSAINGISNFANKFSPGATAAKAVTETAPAIYKGFKDTFSHHADVMNTPNTTTADRVGQQAATGIDLGAQVVDAPFKVAGAAIANNTPDWLKNAGASAVGSATDEIKSIPGAMTAWTKIHELAAEHPSIAQALKGVVTAGADVFMGGAGKLAKDAALPILEKGMAGISDTVKGAKEAVSTATEVVKDNGASTIKDMIMPKPTAKEARLALDQGRLYKGEKGGMFTDGTPDKIAATEQQAKSVATIQKLVPDAHTLDPNTLYSEMNGKIGEIAQNLKPELQKTPISQPTLEKLNNDWQEIKKSQITDAPATEEANVAKRQAKFESYLQKSGSSNMNDLWETAKTYDASIPDRVKQANEMSSEALQLQKDEWLQNRAILRGAINDNENGLGATSRQAFSDMRDLYEAQNGMLSKAKVETKPDPSIVSKWMKDHPTATKVGLGLTGLAGVKEITGF